VDDAPAVCVQVAELAGSSSPGASTLVSGTTSGSSAAGPAAAGSAPAAAAAAAACASAPVAAAAAAGASARGSSFQIRITDWGNGIPPSQFANMFSFFYTSARPASTL
jgi:signal transduction histidine kinase